MEGRRLILGGLEQVQEPGEQNQNRLELQPEPEPESVIVIVQAGPGAVILPGSGSDP